LTVEEIERLAAKNEKMPDYRELPEIFLYQTLAALYTRYRHNSITKEQARKEKNMAIKAYHDLLSAYKKYCKYYRDMQDKIRQGYEEKYTNMKGENG
jgi:hypothetical protein